MPLVNFSGLASGLDFGAIIKTMLAQQKSARITPLQNRIESIQGTNSALSELSGLLSNLQSAAGKFRVINGGISAKLAHSTNEAVATAIASNSAANGSFSINVNSLASNATLSMDDRFNSKNAVINESLEDGVEADRTISITTGTGPGAETVNIVIDNTTTISDLMNSFNAQSNLSSASLVNTGTTSSPSYALVISSNSEGLSKGNIEISVGSDIQTAGNGAFTSQTLKQATNAEYTMSGLAGTLSSESNVINNLKEGITLNLVSTGSTTISVQSDSDATTQSMAEMVEAYNAVVNFISKNSAITEGEDGLNTFGPLRKTSIAKNALSSLRSAMSGSSSEGQSVRIFADLGIKTERDGTISFDQEKFKQALANEPDSVKQITESFGEKVSAVDGTIAQYIGFNNIFARAKKANQSQISDIERRIGRFEDQLARQEQTLTRQFASFEALMGKMEGQRATLNAALQGLGFNF